ncbi:Hypothetical predicted protein [Olea europaea subsp. europaea]|uniref:Uncharacterized protein n=1 Tax=Olea europaea subsp. europaea TaxID=158383 RepID=A0A8S0QRP5_OLEEU|nr:Hypothetical predicted protein [Olea europaea subsp. europaea]
MMPSHSMHKEESPRAAQPPQRGFEINIADLLRTEMEKHEGRLQAVISTRLDRVEKRLTENEPKDGLEKEAEFDNVTDVHAAERKVDLPEEDSKLEEEEVREKNVGGNELKTEPGFDDVKDVSAAETNVEAHEKDPNLDEEVRGKNVGGNDLKKEAGSRNEIDEQENEKMIK